MQHLAATARPGQPLPPRAAAPEAACRPRSLHHGACRLHQRRARLLLRAAASPAQQTVAAVVGTAPAAVDAAETWASFAAAVSGEWEGVTALFAPDGEPLQLPEYYVPQAYRDWGVELYDWQSQSSMLADAEGLTATHRRMMPTVGCEADAIAFMQDAAQLFAAPASSSDGSSSDGSSGSSGGPPTVAPEGGYSAGPADITQPDAFKATFESCLVLEPRRRRLRVAHNLRRLGAEGAWRLDSLDLHSEHYDSPYRGKVELSGCGGGLGGFATSERLGGEALRGPWLASGLRYTCTPSGGCSAEVVSGEAWSPEGLPGLALLPLRAWSACEASGEGGGDIYLAAGALLEGPEAEGGPARMAVVTRRMQGGRLAAVELLTLTRAA